MPLTWMTAFLDLPAASFGRGVDFWRQVTGYETSPRRGEQEEFLTLVPALGDAYLKVQATDGSGPGVHVDLHAEDVGGLADRAVRLGGSPLADEGSYRVLSSPGGFVFCVVDHPVAGGVPPPRGPDGATSQVDQVCLDIPADRYAGEADFWTALTGWERDPGEPDEFENLRRPAGFPLRILLQRLDDPAERVTAHLDLAADDRGSEVARHESLGAERQYDGRGWTTLRDPTGTVYCVTDRVPGTW